MDVRISSTRIAASIMDMRREGRIAMSRASTEAIERAVAVLHMDAVLGVVCAADLHDDMVPRMAEHAFAIGQIVRELDARGLVDLVGTESDMFAAEIVEGIACGFELIVEIVA
jgi:hypothetical protein